MIIQLTKSEFHPSPRTFFNLLCLIISEPRSRTIIAFDPDQWRRWFGKDPKLTKVESRPEEYLAPNSQKFLETGGDVFFLIKSDVQDDVQEIYKYVDENVRDFFGEIVKTESSPASKVTKIVRFLF